MTASSLRSPSSSSSSSSSGRKGDSLDEDDIDSDNSDIGDDKSGDDHQQGSGSGLKKGKKKPVPPPSLQGKYNIDTSDITVVKKNMFREGKVHFYTASLPGFI